ncbi:FctA domain-containing protein [Streptococcus sp. H49]|uniref:Spy0128 family protein n=1 Tax=Streptococcus huangxiaojuni TaxID=3237239 RepID=UPI0034A23C11
MKLKFLGLFSVLAVLYGIFLAQPAVKAAEITDYNNAATLYYDPEATNIEITSATAEVVVQSGVYLKLVNNIEFPDSVAINEGDTLTITLPDEFALVTSTSFPITTADGSTVGTAQADAASKTVTVTFTDHFSKVPENKKMSFEITILADRGKNTDGETTVSFGGVTFSYTYKNEEGEAGDYEMKYGYQAQEDAGIVKWRVVLNATQDMIRDMTISDIFGEGQTLVPGSLRAVRYETQPTKIRSEEHLLTLTPIDNFTDKAVFDYDNSGGITGFTIPFGDNYNWAMYIEYSTYLPDNTPAGAIVNNTLSWSASNFDTRSVEALVRLQTASGTASSEKSEQVVLRATKLLNGKELTDGEFTFELYSAEDLTTPIQTTTNAADGSVTFSAITYSTAGTYQYVIKEKNTSADRITYDSSEYRATVTVTDENGVKMGAVAYDAEPVFTNSYAETTTTSQTTTESSSTTTSPTTTESSSTTTSPTTTESSSTTTSSSATTAASTTEETVTTDPTTAVSAATTETTSQPTTSVTTAEESETSQETSTDPAALSTSSDPSSPTSANNQAKTDKSSKKLPNTGEQAGIFLTGLGIVILAISALFFFRRKK